jgi:hypothetical protein
MAKLPPHQRPKNNLNQGAALVTYNPLAENAGQIVAEASAKALQSYTVIPRGGSATADSNRTRWQNIDTNTSIRNDFRRGDYERFRPSERIPIKPKEIMLFAMQAYRRVGLMRNVIDLMGDFASQGIRLIHPVPSVQAFYQKWFNEVVCGPDRSERWCNLFYRIGTVASMRSTGKVSLKVSRQMRAVGLQNKKISIENDGENIEDMRVERRTIPTKYTFLNPLILETIGGELSQFVGDTIYAIKIPSVLQAKIQFPRSEQERQLISKLPSAILQAAREGRQVVALDVNKLNISFYKKDDWQQWADPMTYGIFNDLLMLEKMKLADLSALDGVISQVRIWKLGDLERGILPTDEAIDKLAEILLSNPGGGAFDLIWGPDLQVEEYKTNIHQFLGNEKYVPVLDALHEGLGVPVTITGGLAGASNNFIAMKTLIKRLEYGRMKLKEFWTKEIKIVQKAMGFSKPATIEFDRMILTDEDAEKALLIQLWDRNIISDEVVISRIGESPEMELLRKRKEEKQRKGNRRPEKAGPYFVAEKEHDLIKTALGRGYIHPEQTSITLEETDAVPPFDKQLGIMEKKLSSGGPGNQNQTGNTGRSGEGRPKGSKDSQKRSGRTFKPQDGSSAEHFLTVGMWAKETQNAIADIVTPLILKFHKKKTLVQLSAEQTSEAERLKFAVLCNLSPFSNINEKIVGDVLNSKPSIPQGMKALESGLQNKFFEKFDRKPNMKELRHIQASVYALMQEK